MALCMALYAALPPAQAQTAAVTESLRQYDVPAGALSTGLSAWGVQSDQQLVFAPELIAGKQSRGVFGRYGAEEALAKLLDGTGLRSERVNAQTYTLKPDRSKAPKEAPTQNRDPSTSQTTQASQIDQSGQPDQGRATELKAVVVTGSRIRQVDIETQQPVLTLTHQQIADTGLTNVADVLNQLPAIQQSPGANRRSTQSLTAGGQFADMRGLGAQRVLVLVNGHRWVTGSNGTTDLSTITAAVIDHIEVLKDGASAIYGSDAIAGVINIITRKDFKGLDVSTNLGVNDAGDGQKQQYSVTVGGDVGKGSIMATASYLKEDPIWNKTRELTRYGDGPLHPFTSNYAAVPEGRFTYSKGSFILNQLGLDTTQLSNYHQVDPRNLPPEDTFNVFEQKPFVTGMETKSLYIQGGYDFTENLSAYETILYSERNAPNNVGIFPLDSNYFHLSNGLMSKDSIYNPVDEDIRIDVSYPAHPRLQNSLSRTSQVVAGLRGTFPVGEHTWNWDIDINYSKVAAHTTLYNNFDFSFMQRAMGPSFYDANGTPQCGTPGNIIFDCIPLNIMAGPTAFDGNPALEKRMFVLGSMDTINRRKSYEANLTGGIFSMPHGGEVAIAVGVEHQSLFGSSLPDSLSQTGVSSNNVSLPSSGGYDVNAAYIEASIPLLKDLRGARLLSFDLADRYTNYSTFGSTSTKKIGFQYRPIDDLMLRGTYGEGFRAPTISDVSAGISQGYGTYTDPCDAVYGPSIYGTAIHNTCVNTLQAFGYPDPANFRQVGVTQAPVTAANQQTANPFYNGATPGLGPETSKTLTAGLVYDPSYLPGFGITLDWWQIKLSNIIANITANDVLQGCYQGIQQLCSRFTRDARGQVLNLFTGQANRGEQKVQGVDIGAKYQMPETSVGTFGVAADFTYSTKWEAQQKAGAPIEQRVGWATSAGDFWRLRGNLVGQWRKGNFSAQWRVRYFSSLTEACFWGTKSECSNPGHVDPFHGNFPTNRVPAVAFNDASVSWKSFWNSEITLGVNNIFDRSPPIDYQRPVLTPPITVAYDIDRYWFINYVQHF
jgi:iron complex outermembrane receptor protein